MNKCKLGDLLTIKHGYAFKSTNYVRHSKYALVTLANISGTNNFQFNREKTTYYGADFPDDFILQTGDLIMPLTEQVIGLFGNSAFVPSIDDITFVLNQRVGKVIPKKDKADKYYLHYLLSTEIVREQLEYRASGTRQRNISPDDIYDVDIFVPNYEVQKRIGETLYKLEEKINNNNKLNAELESMAKTIYDYWFLQFEFPNEDGKPYKSSGGKMVWNEELKREIPKGWTNGTFEDLGEIIAGGTPSTSHPEYYSEQGIAWITPNDLSNSNDKYITHGERDISGLGMNNSSAKLMPEGTVLLTSRAPIGYLGIAANEVCTNQGFKSIVPNRKFGSEFIYYTVEKMVVYLKALGTGSTFTEISKAVVAEVKIVIPEESIALKFENMISETAAKHKIIEKENRELISLRDYLLPLLMNGQVGFKD